MIRIFWYLIWSFRLGVHLASKPRLRAQLRFEIDRPQSSQTGTWLYYDHWPAAWKARLLDFCVAYSLDGPLPIASPLPLADSISMGDLSRLGYRNVELARDTYLAQVAHTLWIDMTRKLPWRLGDWSDHELSFLLSSHVLFTAYRTASTNDLYYVVHAGSRTETTENILGDPRIAWQFLLQEPEQQRCLMGATPSETCQHLSEWFHDYLWHNPDHTVFSSLAFHQAHPLLSDRLKRHIIPGYGLVYATTSGCGSASSLFADLMRSVNIPVRKVTNVLESASGSEERHIGLVFNWQGGNGMGRYLLHTDDLYTSSYFKDPAPAPKNTLRGVPLWNHVWLNPTEFGEYFNYDGREDVIGKATLAERRNYQDKNDWFVCSANAIRIARSLGREGTINFLQNERGLTRAEAEVGWSHVEASVLAYGDGDVDLGYQRLLDGPASRHQKWCQRTNKCN